MTKNETLESRILDLRAAGKSRYDATAEAMRSGKTLKVHAIELAAMHRLELPDKATKADAVKAVLTKIAAQVDDAESIEFLAAEEAAQKAERDAAAPVLSGELVLAAEDVLAGDDYHGTKLAEVQVAQKWVYFKNKAGDWFMQTHRGVKVAVTR